MATLVSQILGAKGRDVWSIRSTDTVREALHELADKGIGALVVVDDGEVVGMLSERDYARKVILQGKDSASTKVADIMSTKVVTIDPDASVHDCIELMTERRFRHLPVMDHGKLIGVVSIGDVVKAVIDDQRFLIEQLERYITT